MYNIKVLRYWKYDLETLYTENMYLLYPLQLFKLRKTMEHISHSKKGYDEKKIEMFRLYDELTILVNKTLKAIDKAYYDGKINLTDYNEMNIIIENLNCYFAYMYGKYRDIEEEVRSMVKSFYDPKVEEKGRNEGIKEGIKEEKEKSRLKDVGRLEKLLTKKFGLLPDNITEKIRKADEDALNSIIESILDIEKLDDVLRYLEY